jgi:hypothetical protein
MYLVVAAATATTESCACVANEKLDNTKGWLLQWLAKIRLLARRDYGNRFNDGYWHSSSVHSTTEKNRLFFRWFDYFDRDMYWRYILAPLLTVDQHS